MKKLSFNFLCVDELLWSHMNFNSLSIGESLILKKIVQNLFAPLGQTGIVAGSILVAGPYV